MAARVHLAVIPSEDAALCDLGTFAFVVLHFFCAGRRHSASVSYLLRLIDRLEYLYTKVQGMISYPHLATTLLYYVPRRWRHYLNRCVVVSASEVVESPRASVPFSLEPIIVEMEGGGYISPILPIFLANLFSGRRSTGGGAPISGVIGGGSGGGIGDSGGDNKNPTHKVGATGGPSQVQVHYEVHLPSLFLRYGYNFRYIMEGVILPTLHIHIICKN